MSKRMWVVILILVALLLATIGFDVFKKQMIAKAMANFKAPPQVVETVNVTTATWKPTLQSVGTLTAIHGVDVSAEVSGQVRQIHFKSGDLVQQGQPLVQLDDSLDQANYQNHVASLNLAKVKYQRQTELKKTGATSIQSFDEAKADLEESKAMVKADRVRIDKKNIRAPVSGKIGIRQVDIGQYVQPGQALVSLQSMDPLYVDFFLPEQELKHVVVGQPVKIQVTSSPNHAFQAAVSAIDAKVDQATRNFKVRALVPNKHGQLYPGVYANVSVILPEEKHVITIPQNAITYTLYGDSVYLVKPMAGQGKAAKPLYKAVRQPVKLGDVRNNVVSVLSGLKAGDTIVSAGQVKIQNGSVITINNSMSLQQGS